MQTVAKPRADRASRPRLAFFALLLGVLACTTTLTLPTVEKLDRSLQEKSLIHVEKPVTVLGVESTLKYVKTQRRGWLQHPLLVATLALILAGISASALSMRSLVAGRPTWAGAAGLMAGAGAIALTLYFNPLAWIMIVLLVPALISILLTAAYVGVEHSEPVDGALGIDTGHS